MKKIIGILICTCMMFSTICIQAEQIGTRRNTLTPQPTTDRVAVTIFRQAFHPNVVIMEPNQTVVWTNLEPQPHSIVSDDGYFHSQLLGQGESFNYTFAHPGLFPYHDGAYPATTGKVYVEIGGNRPPNKPLVNGTASGKMKVIYNYTAATFDPEGSMVSYYFDWGDNTNSGWSPFINSSTPVTLSHSWNKRGNFVIKVQAKDFYANATSGWTTFPVTMPLSNDLPGYHFLENLFARFPHIFPVLRHLMGY